MSGENVIMSFDHTPHPAMPAGGARSVLSSRPLHRPRLCLQACVAPVLWLALHILIITHLLLADSDTGRAARAGKLHHILPASGLCLATLVLFFQLYRSDPGYLAIAQSKATRSPPTCSSALVDTGSALLIGGTAADDVPAEAAAPKQSGTSGLAAAYCTVCGTSQPVRSKHCHKCHRCVLRFDHHCVWLGTCVGKRNQVLFVAYLYFQLALIVLAAHNSVTAFSLSGLDEGDLQQLGTLAAMLACVLGGSFVGCLAGFHAYLACTNQTTYEVTRQHKHRAHYLRRRQHRPFDRGLWANLLDFVYPTSDHEAVCATYSDAKHRPLPVWVENKYYSCF